MKQFKIQTAIAFSSGRSVLRGASSVAEIWPNRVITIGGFRQDQQRQAGDWARVSSDLGTVFKRATVERG